MYLIHAFVVLAFLRTDWGRDLIPLPHGGIAAFFVHAGVVLAITLPLAWISWHASSGPSWCAPSPPPTAGRSAGSPDGPGAASSVRS